MIPLPTTSETEQIERSTTRKVAWRIVPFVTFLFVVSNIDKGNIGFAALRMNRELGISAQVFGLAAGLFFVGYFLFEVPSNHALVRFGARQWIARILVTWGVISALTAFAQNETHLYVLRFLLGAAEAGFYPGIVIYLNRWFRSKQLATVLGVFTASVPFSYVVSAPLSTAIIQHVSWFGLSGWRWMFLVEGVPAVILGVVAYFFLTNEPAGARWLTEAQRSWLVDAMTAEHAQRREVSHRGVWRTMLNPRVLQLSAIYFVFLVGSIGTSIWLPQIVASFSSSLTATQVGFLATIPYLAGTVAMIWWGHRSDMTGERKVHTWVPMAVAAVSMVVAGFVHSPLWAMVAITISMAGLYAFKAPFWAMPSQYLSPAALVTAAASINSIGNLGGFVGTYALGVITGVTKNNLIGLAVLGVMVLLACVLTLLLKRPDTDAEEPR